MAFVGNHVAQISQGVFQNFIVKVQPYQCTIDEDNELYHKIIDTVNWYILKVLNQYSSALNDLHRDSAVDAVYQSSAFIKAIKELIEQELLTNIEVFRIQTFLNYEDLEENLNICILIKLDQNYIDYYEENLANQMFESTMKDLQKITMEQKEEVQMIAKPFYHENNTCPSEEEEE